jgi:hypothetical protein
MGLILLFALESENTHLLLDICFVIINIWFEEGVGKMDYGI